MLLPEYLTETQKRDVLARVLIVPTVIDPPPLPPLVRDSMQEDAAAKKWAQEFIEQEGLSHLFPDAEKKVSVDPIERFFDYLFSGRILRDAEKTYSRVDPVEFWASVVLIGWYICSR